MDSRIKRGLKWRKMKKDIPKIIGIFIMGKTMAGIDKVVTRTAECDLDTGALFWDRHRKYFINLQKFKFDEGNITLKNIWFHSFKNLGSMENIDSSVYERADEGLLRLIEKARVGALSAKDQMRYEASLKMLEDEEPTYDEGLKEGREEGLKEGREEGLEEGRKEGREEGANEKAVQIATDMKRKGLDAALIHELTHLTLKDIEKL